MKSSLLAGCLLAAFPAVALGQFGRVDRSVVDIVAADDGSFLGCFTCAKSDLASVFNGGSVFYSLLSSPFSRYGGKFENTSMCNMFASNPRRLVHNRGRFGAADIGKASVNAFAAGGICNVASDRYWSAGCRSLTDLCAGF